MFLDFSVICCMLSKTGENIVGRVLRGVVYKLWIESAICAKFQINEVYIGMRNEEIL